LDERLQDVHTRYQGRVDRVEEPMRSSIREDAHSVELRIFEHCNISASDVTHASTRIYATQLWDFELENVKINDTNTLL
jgi:hypothetical protein